jgi:hypothetical protein
LPIQAPHEPIKLPVTPRLAQDIGGSSSIDRTHKPLKVCPQDSLSKPSIHVGMEIREALNGDVQ